MASGRIEVRTHGTSGSEVVVLHGGPGGQGSAETLAAALAPSFRVTEPLQRRGGNAPLSVGLHVADLAEVAPKKASYVGWSWGAMLGLSFAALHPERVSTLVLVGCGCYDEESREAHAIDLRRRLGPEGQARLEDLECRMAGATDRGWRDSIFGQIGALIEHAEAVDPTGTTAGDVEPDAQGFEETWADVQRLQHEGVEPRRFSQIGCPVLMLHGSDDTHPGKLIRDALRPHIPHLAYIEFSACGHVPWLERSARDSFLTTLEDWLQETG